MARPKCYETQALKQKAYRERKKNLSVSVPTESESEEAVPRGLNTLNVKTAEASSEAREGNCENGRLSNPTVAADNNDSGSHSDELWRRGVAPERLPNKPAQFETKKVGEFRMLVMPEEVKDAPVMPVVKPKVFLNDHGAVISERTWNILQEKKRIAKENGYEFDPQ